MQTLKFAPIPYPIVRGLGGHPGTFVIEPASMYASQPADKKAFCAAAHASACAYLPPQQTVAQGNGSATDPDFLITDPQCSHEGGTMVTVQGIAGSPSSTSCNFVYATNVSVPFKPAKDFKLKQSASCHSPWTYSVDVHGAVSIAIAAGTPVVVTTGSVATCVVRVVTGP